MEIIKTESLMMIKRYDFDYSLSALLIRTRIKQALKNLVPTNQPQLLRLRLLQSQLRLQLKLMQSQPPLPGNLMQSIQ
ncbi:hypothetical protein SAMN05216490_2091 [Mucilaginibacter mallensis]|uniref:Uncharacterized protein n=1 Tax=Mucilaginibacter mallensis TaxID=652787 RepID=A0A1H1W491_MUCMA|nr:hypothetical protein SAMN05216490_2091 [Mucilaginibacter mallensis]